MVFLDIYVWVNENKGVCSSIPGYINSISKLKFILMTIKNIHISLICN